MDLFKNFFKSEKSAGFILIGCTIISLLISNSNFSNSYIHFWHSNLDLSFFNISLNYSLEHWVNDGLMTIFFFLVGLEIERELYIGELSNFKTALLPILAATGGLIFPALIHFVFNVGTETQSGFAIPMATDIAFALGILSLAGKTIPVSLKIFLTALAIIDDLGAISVIAIFYTDSIAFINVLICLAIFIFLFICGRKKVQNLVLYLVGGISMWYFLLKSGIHPSIAGVLLAFCIPFHKIDSKNISYNIQNALHYPVAFIILPIFALANTALIIPGNIMDTLKSVNSLGIIVGLIAGKFIGIFLISYLAVRSKIAKLPTDVNWMHILGIALLGGIGFTMSMFISNLAFDNSETIISSKISVLLASVVAAIAGLTVLKLSKSIRQM